MDITKPKKFDLDINDLSIECFVEIFGFLNWQDFKIINLVCKFWHNILKSQKDLILKIACEKYFHSFKIGNFVVPKFRFRPKDYKSDFIAIEILSKRFNSESFCPNDNSHWAEEYKKLKSKTFQKDYWYQSFFTKCKTEANGMEMELDYVK